MVPYVVLLPGVRLIRVSSFCLPLGAGDLRSEYATLLGEVLPSCVGAVKGLPQQAPSGVFENVRRF